MNISDYHNTTVGTAIDSMRLLSSSLAHVLFDIAASHSFISMLFVSMLGLDYETVESTLSVGIPLGTYCELFFQCSLI